MLAAGLIVGRRNTYPNGKVLASDPHDPVRFASSRHGRGVDGRQYLVARDDLRAGPSTLVDTAVEGGPVAGLVTPGVVRNIVRIR